MPRPSGLPTKLVSNLIVELKVYADTANMEWDETALGGIEYEHGNNQYSCYRYNSEGGCESKSFSVMNTITIDSRNYNDQLKHLFQPGLDWIGEINKNGDNYAKSKESNEENSQSR